jgi:hypothetical protein
MTGDLYKLTSLKSRVQQGEYRVDPRATADAMIRWFTAPSRRRHGERTPYDIRSGRRPQNECSNPDSGPSASVNTMPGGPSTTDPIQLRRLVIE